MRFACRAAELRRDVPFPTRVSAGGFNHFLGDLAIGLRPGIETIRRDNLAIAHRAIKNPIGVRNNAMV